MMRDNENLPSDFNLDQAIREALQVETDQEQIASLEHYWIVQSKRNRRRLRARLAIPLAAAMLAIVAAFTLKWNQPEDTQFAENIGRVAPVREDSKTVDPILADNAQVEARSHSAGRPSTAYERLMFTARTHVRVPAASLKLGIDHVISQLTLDPAADAKQALVSSGARRIDAETELLRRLPRAANAQKVVILQLLAVCGTQRSVPVLLRLGKHDMIRDDALATIEQIVGIENLAQVINTTAERELRVALMQRLLSTDSKPALFEYLSLVWDEAVRLEALAVAKEAPQLPIDELLTLLDHEEQEVRFTAAMVLGHVNGPEVTRLLIARVTSQPSDSTEAWMALLACRGDLAERFLAYATHRPQLLGYCNYARVQWAQLIP